MKLLLFLTGVVVICVGISYLPKIDTKPNLINISKQAAPNWLAEKYGQSYTIIINEPKHRTCWSWDHGYGAVTYCRTNSGKFYEIKTFNS